MYLYKTLPGHFYLSKTKEKMPIDESTYFGVITLAAKEVEFLQIIEHMEKLFEGHSPLELFINGCIWRVLQTLKIERKDIMEEKDLNNLIAQRKEVKSCQVK